MKIYNKIIIWIVVILVISGGAWYIFSYKQDSIGKPNVLDSFAQCLTEKGAVMYGAEWCVHCQNQKAAFGSAFQYVTYVECPDDPQKCIEVGIQGYPTWAFKDGKKLAGEQSFSELSQASGCPLPSGVK